MYIHTDTIFYHVCLQFVICHVYTYVSMYMHMHIAHFIIGYVWQTCWAMGQELGPSDPKRSPKP